MMGKIGIITINGYYNYGNRLQNYALQEVLIELGFDVETIINNTKFYIQTEPKSKLQKIKEKSLNELYFITKKKIENYLYKNKLNQQRTEKFKEFSFKYINEKDFGLSEKNIPDELINRYDFFITGSDQVWNPHFRKGSPIEFLTFAPQEKRIAYAASFGISKIPDKYVENYRKWLSEMAHLSVREESGVEIIEDLTGRDASVVLDPTMLLTKEEWLSVSEVPSNKPMKQYLLTYFLGDISKERMKILKNIAKKNDLEIVHLAQFKDKTSYVSGPSEFLDFINSASLFCTDSFHGAVFSIILDTPFIVFKREGKLPSMNSRIETLLKTFKLESRLADNIKTNSQVFEIDYSHTVPIFENERKKSLDYLKKTLNLN